MSIAARASAVCVMVAALEMGGSTALRVAATVHGRDGTDCAAAVAYYPYCFDYL